ncbi:glycoside hydrolase family 128 protein [Myriangium duriaei CBS 260.36]|uniref:Glycoside hydrolase family 128 protein n=1 Tax=Myriangium duriaei CBS 260.36 TaxID=1168546 RepID=A0A9P4J561_9PEZI|nr:glycoside hydrolase family 128 protein [Myriangium duriaei CBS 260.36]
MAPVTQLSLVFLTTASVALAHRGHQARGARHSHKRTQPYSAAPYGNGNGNGTTPSVYPTGNSTATVPVYTLSTADITQTRTETRTSTITEYVTEETPAGGYQATGSVSGAAVGTGTCGGTAYVTVTDTVTVTAGSESSSSSSSSAPAPVATTTTTTTTTTQIPAYTSSAPAATLAPSSPAAAYQPPSSSTTTSEAVTSVVPASLPAYSVPAYSSAAPQSSSTTSSAAASTPTSGGASGSNGLRTKRGCLYISGSNNDCSILGDSTISWATNWGAAANGGAGGNVYIPQLWGHMSTDGTTDFTATWTANAQAAIDAGACAVLGYNEPDLKTQSNMTPEEGAALWHYVSAFSGKATVVSPSVTSTQQGNSYPGLDWLSSFQTAGASWDATGVHFYGDCTQEPSSQITYLQNMINEAHTRFGKPVWVTEFGCNAGASTDQIANFLKTALPYLEGESKCAQYAAFNAGLLVSGSSLNAAGSVYASISSS